MELKEVSEQVDKVMEAVNHVQTKCDEFEGKMNGEVNASIEAATKAATDAMEALQEHKQEQVAKEQERETEFDMLKKKLARAAAGGNADELPEMEAKYKNQFIRYCRKGKGIDEDVVEEIAREVAHKQSFGVEDAHIELLAKDLAAGSNPDGGYWVRPEVASFLNTRVFETSPIRGVANVVTIGSDSLEIIIDDDEAASGGWVGEVSERNNTDTPKIGKQTIVAHEQYAMPRVTQKMLDDASIDIEAWLQGKVARKFARVENTAFIRGDGAEKPKGILSYANAPAVDEYKRYTLGTLEAAGAAIDGDDLKTLQNALLEEYQGSAIWGMKRSTFGDVIKLKDNQGQYIFQSRFLNEMDQMVLLGKPVVFMDDMDAVASESYPIVYGDFGVSYTIVDRTGIRVIRDEVTEKPYILLYTTKRVGGDVTNFQGLKRLQMPT